MIDIGITGSIHHQVGNPGKIVCGSPTKGGEVTFSFDPADFESQKKRAENAIRLLEYAKYLYANPESLPSAQVNVQSGGAGAKVGGKS